MPIMPGSTIGILGGGQLGRMLAFEAKKSGYKVIVLEPTPKCPTAQVCDEQIVAEYDDLVAAKKLAEQSDVVTYEFENVDVNVVKELEKFTTVYPGSHVLEISQHRVREKTFFKNNNIPVTDFYSINSLADLESAEENIGFPAVLKTCRFGYDGKGQKIIKNRSEAEKAFTDLNSTDLIWEKLVPFTKEISVVSARNISGEFTAYPIPENIHIDNILDTSIIPARIEDKTKIKAIEIAKKIAEKLNIIGVFAVEMFVLDNGDILANEIAPRTHNSGHYTIEGCLVSQFANQLRAICDLPLGNTALRLPTVMVNIIGDGHGQKLHGIEELLKDKNINLHLYGKSEAKAKRKMGHFTIVGQDLETIIQKSAEARKKIYWGD